jgi:hypothetical protein
MIARLAICSWGLSKYCASAVQVGTRGTSCFAKAFDSILNSVVTESQRSPGAKVKLTLEIEAEAPSGFNDADAGVVHHNTKQLKFTPGSTGFSD